MTKKKKGDEGVGGGTDLGVLEKGSKGEGLGKRERVTGEGGKISHG